MGISTAAPLELLALNINPASWPVVTPTARVPPLVEGSHAAVEM